MIYKGIPIKKLYKLNNLVKLVEDTWMILPNKELGGSPAELVLEGKIDVVIDYLEDYLKGAPD